MLFIQEVSKEFATARHI